MSDHRPAVELVVELDPSALVDAHALARVREEYARLDLTPQSGDVVRWEVSG